MRFPVHHVDRFFLLFDLPPPVSCAWVFEVDGGSPDPDRLRDAVRHVLRAHPKAAARLVGRGTRAQWETIDGGDLRAFAVDTPLEGADGTAAEEERLRRIMSSPLEAREGPLLRVHWIPPGAHAARLVVRFHHALADGSGSLVLVRSLLEAYEGGASAAVAEAPPPRPAPLVAGGFGRKLGLLSRLSWLHVRHSTRHRLALPETLFPPGSRPSGGMAVAIRRVPPSRRQRLLAAAVAAGARLPDVLFAAAALAAERALAEQGRRCGMLRLQVTRDLRRRRADPAAVENRSSAFPIWIGRADRADPAGLVGVVHRQVREAVRSNAAEGTALFAAALRLPEPLARRLLLPLATRPRIADSLIVTWLGTLPASDPHSGWFHLGGARFTRARAVLRPAEGVGASLVALELGEGLELALSYLSGLYEPAAARRYLELVDTSLDELAAAGTRSG